LIAGDIVRTVRAGNYGRGYAQRQVVGKKIVRCDAIDWGKKHEPTALAAYSALTGADIRPCGIYIDSDENFFGGSPDGISTDGLTLIEIKCPYSVRDNNPSAVGYLSGNMLNKQHKN
jgi:hypothetical protein